MFSFLKKLQVVLQRKDAFERRSDRERDLSSSGHSPSGPDSQIWGEPEPGAPPCSPRWAAEAQVLELAMLPAFQDTAAGGWVGSRIKLVFKHGVLVARLVHAAIFTEHPVVSSRPLHVQTALPGRSLPAEGNCFFAGSALSLTSKLVDFL